MVITKQYPWYWCIIVVLTKPTCVCSFVPSFSVIGNWRSQGKWKEQYTLQDFLGSHQRLILINYAIFIQNSHRIHRTKLSFLCQLKPCSVWLRLFNPKLDQLPLPLYFPNKHPSSGVNGIVNCLSAQCHNSFVPSSYIWLPTGGNRIFCWFYNFHSNPIQNLLMSFTTTTAVLW